MKRASPSNSLKKIVKKVKRTFSRSSKMETVRTPSAATDRVSEEQDRLLQPCSLHSTSHKLFQQQKAATLPCMSSSGINSCPLYEVCCNCNSPVCSTSNSSILSADSGLGEDEDDNDVFYSENESEVEEDIESMVNDDDWWINGNQISLRKVLSSSSCETIYSGYWHGNVEVHARRSSDSELRAGVIADINTLTNIRHENIQLFLGVSRDLLTDCVSIVMDQMKGRSLHHLIHKQNKQFSCESLNKIASQIAQGVEYLHAKGISHPLLSSKAITFHYHVCISMLSNYDASSGHVETEDLVYLPPQAIRTVSLPSCQSETGASSTAPLRARSDTLLRPESNVYSFGTLMYEILSCEKPYPGTAASTLISLVGSKDRVLPLAGLPSGLYKQIVRKCWRYRAEDRPTFKELSWTLDHNATPKSCGVKSLSQFSFSEPLRLNKLGV